MFKRYLSCSMVIMVVLLSVAPTCFSAERHKIKRYLTTSGMEQVWDTQIQGAALESFTDALRKSGKFTANQLKEETASMKEIFKNNLSYKMVSSDLELCLVNNLQDEDVDFLIKCDLRIIPETPENEAIFQKKFENVDMCMKSIIRIKLRKLKQDGLI